MSESVGKLLDKFARGEEGVPQEEGGPVELEDESLEFTFRVEFTSIRQKPGRDDEVSVLFVIRTTPQILGPLEAGDLHEQFRWKVYEAARALVHEHLGWPYDRMGGWLGVRGALVTLHPEES